MLRRIPNIITLVRIALIVPIAWLLLDERYLAGLVLMAIAGLSDALDGALARRFSWSSAFGAYADPLADKLLITAALVSLVQMGRAETWMVAIILGRELAVTVLRSLTHARGGTMAASRLGKLKMALQVLAVLLLILGSQVRLFGVVGQVALWLVLVTAVASAMRYYRRFRILAEPNVADFESARHRLVRDDREDARPGVGRGAAAG